MEENLDLYSVLVRFGYDLMHGFVPWSRFVLNVRTGPFFNANRWVSLGHRPFRCGSSPLEEMGEGGGGCRDNLSVAYLTCMG